MGRADATLPTGRGASLSGDENQGADVDMLVTQAMADVRVALAGVGAGVSGDGKPIVVATEAVDTLAE